MDNNVLFKLFKKSQRKKLLKKGYADDIEAIFNENYGTCTRNYASDTTSVNEDGTVTGTVTYYQVPCWYVTIPRALRKFLETNQDSIPFPNETFQNWSNKRNGTNMITMLTAINNNSNYNSLQNNRAQDAIEILGYGLDDLKNNLDDIKTQSNLTQATAPTVEGDGSESNPYVIYVNQSPPDPYALSPYRPAYPYYNFYSDSEGLYETYFTSNGIAGTYTYYKFRRFRENKNYPFLINESPGIEYIGDKPTTGISGDESFTIKVENTVFTVVYYCTAEPNTLTSNFTIHLQN